MLPGAFLKRNWDVFAGTLGYQLGFRSPKAQEYLRRGSDHHKSWHFLEILYVAITLELVTPYVKESLSSGRIASCEGYWQWCESLLDPNYVYMHHMVLTYMHVLMML